MFFELSVFWRSPPYGNFHVRRYLRVNPKQRFLAIPKSRYSGLLAAGPGNPGTWAYILRLRYPGWGLTLQSLGFQGYWQRVWAI